MSPHTLDPAEDDDQHFHGFCVDHDEPRPVKPVVFSLDNLDVFRRPGCTLERRDDVFQAGVWIDLANGWRVSVQWGKGNYGDNYNAEFNNGRKPADSTTAEIAVLTPERNMVEWGTEPDWAECVQGYCSMARVQHVIDLVERGRLMQEYQPPTPAPVMRAIDGWKDGK